MGWLGQILSRDEFMPHVHCYLGNVGLTWTMMTTDTLIGLAYIGISVTLWALLRKIKIPFNFVVLCFGVFIAACGLTHFMEVYNLWVPRYWLAAVVKVVTAVASVGTGIYLYRLRHPIVTVAEAAKLSEQRRLDLEALTKSLEERVEERTSELRRAVSIRDEFFSVASHEFRTPLTALKMKTQLARRSPTYTAAPPTEQKFIADLETQVDRLVKLVDDMLDISRFRSGQLQVNAERQNLSEVVRTTLDRFRPQLQQKGITLQTELTAQVSVPFDRLRIEQVLVNLLSNAMKYAPDAPLHVGLTQDARYAYLRVKDEGPGIAAEDQERIFEKFERLVSSQHVSGLGVGLYLSRSIVEAHGGTLKIQSAPGQGAEFMVALPLQARNQERTVQISPET